MKGGILIKVITFVFDEKNSVYLNTVKQGNSIALGPQFDDYRDIESWDRYGNVTIADHEVATITNNDASSMKVGETVHVDQQEVGPVMLRMLVKLDEIDLTTLNAYWSIYVDIRHHDVTHEYGKYMALPLGKYPWWQFSIEVNSDAGKTIDYVYVYLALKYKKGVAHGKWPEILDYTKTTKFQYGEAYSKPECIYESTTPKTGQGALKMPSFGFYYGDLEEINEMFNTSHAIEIMGKFDYFVVDEPNDISTISLFITDSIKNTVNIFGYVAMGTDPLPDMISLKAAVDRIAAQGWYGVFLDCFGYDYDETRARQNEIVNYIHSKGLKAFVNAWNVDDALGSIVDATHNPDGTPPVLNENDWYLCESFLMSETGFRDWYTSIVKYQKCQQYQETLGVKMTALSYARSGTTWEVCDSDVMQSYLLALCLGFNGWFFSGNGSLSTASFLSKDIPNYNYGNIWASKLEQIAPYWYMAETDTYIIVFNVENYPPLGCTIYDKTKKRTVLSGITVLYSDDLEQWGETPGKFVREKRILVEK